MNRILSLSLILVLLLSCVGCGGTPNANQSDNSTNAALQQSIKQDISQNSQAPQIPEKPDTEDLVQTIPPEIGDIPDTSDDVIEEPYVRTIDPTAPMVALTFDDGPHKTNSHALLDILEENHSVATFFEVARNISQCPDALTRMLEMGCEIGSHSNAHQNLSKLKQAAILADLNTADEAFIAATGQAPTLVRPPYGATNKAVRMGSGRSVITWTVDTMDWKLKDAQKVTEYIQNYGDLDGQIVLLHSIHDTTVESMKTVIPWLIEQGYQLVTVTELMAYYYGEYPEPNKYYGYEHFRGLGRTDAPLEIPEGGIVTEPVEIPVIDVVTPSPSQPVVETPPAEVPPTEVPPTEIPPAEETPPTGGPPAVDVPIDTPISPSPNTGEITDPSQQPEETPPTEPGGTTTAPPAEFPFDPQTPPADSGAADVTAAAPFSPPAASTTAPVAP